MKNALVVLSLLLAGCSTTGSEVESSGMNRASYLATLSPEDRETFELFYWASEVDPEPITRDFRGCVDQRVGAATADMAPLAVSEAAIDDCFPIIDRLVRGMAMRVPALSTGVTGEQMRYWADHQAQEQRAELLAQLTMRIQESRAGSREE